MSEKLLSDDDLVAVEMLAGVVGDKIKAAFEPMIDAIVHSVKIALSVDDRHDQNRVGYLIVRQLVVSKAVTEIAAYMLGRTYASSVTPNITMLTADMMLKSLGQGLVDGAKGKMLLEVDITTKAPDPKDKDVHAMTQHFAAVGGLEIMAHALRESKRSDNTNRPRPPFKIV